MNIQDTTRSLANAVSNIMAGHSIEKVELTEAKETTVPFEKMNVLTPDEWDQVQNFKNFNEKEWKWNAIQKKFIRLKKVKEESVEEGNEFTAAAAKAKLAGEDEFEFEGKTYPVEIEQDAAEKILGKKESTDLEEAMNRNAPDSVRDAYGEIILTYRSSADRRSVEALLKKAGINVNVNDDNLETDSNSPAFRKAGITKTFDSSKREKMILKLLGESVDLEEAVKFWTVTVTKKAGKLFKGQTVDVKASNSAEAIKKGLKQMKVDNPMTVPSGSVDAVLAESLKEAVKPSNGKSTIGLDVVDAKSAMKDMKKFNLKTKEGKGNGSADEVIVTGKNADIFKYLTSDYYDMDTDEIEEFYPELYESVDLEEAVSQADIKKILAAAKKAGGDIKGNQIDFGMGAVIDVSIEKGKIKLDGGESNGVEYFKTAKDAVMTFESVDLEEATMSQGVKTAATQIYSLEKSLKVGSNLNKGINKSLEGKYDADFKKMQKAIGDIINVWEEIERDFSEMNEVEEPKAQGEKDFKALHVISATDPEEAGNDQPIAPRP